MKAHYSGKQTYFTYNLFFHSLTFGRHLEMLFRRDFLSCAKILDARHISNLLQQMQRNQVQFFQMAHFVLNQFERKTKKYIYCAYHDWNGQKVIRIPTMQGT